MSLGERMGVEEEKLLEWAKGLGICDYSSAMKPPGESSSPPSCLGHSLCIFNFPTTAGGRGLAAARDIRRGDLILNVPESALFTSKSIILKDDRISFSVRSHPSLSPFQVLVICVLAEVNKGKRSFWHPYLRQLPRSYDLLSCFTELEARALQVEGAVLTAERAASKAELEWKQALSLLEELQVKPQLLTLRAWLWASATVSSRTLYIPWDDAGCLCPVGDLFNYSSPSSLITESISEGRMTDAGFEENVGAYCFYARKNYLKGEQVLMNYGMYTNLELLEYYGFVLNENDNDKVFIQFDRGEWSRILSSLVKPPSIYITHEGEPSFCMMLALRMLVGSKNKAVGHLIYSGSPLLPKEEVEVFEMIVTWCTSTLQSLETSAEQDIHLLRLLEEEFCKYGDNDDGGRRLKLALLWRIQHKTILLRCISHCTKAINSIL